MDIELIQAITQVGDAITQVGDAIRALTGSLWLMLIAYITYIFFK